MGGVALFFDLGLDAFELGLGGTCFLDFFRLPTFVDDNLFSVPVFGKDEGAGVGSLGDLAGVTVAGKDLGLAGILVGDRGEGEC